MKPRLAHIINPVIVKETSDLHAAQPVTFESMRRAKEYAAKTADVELFSANFPEDTSLVPDWITHTRELDRSILNVGNLFKKQRKLPLLNDILDRLYENSQADYFIYTNVDIALMPYFYTTVAQLIESGTDAMVINRRTIAKKPSDPMQIELMWAQAGEKHPGYDCFIFRREAYEKFALGSACLGANWIGRVLLANVCAHARNFKIFEDLHLTFHLGDDRAWKVPEHTDYDNYNLHELLDVLPILIETGRPENRCFLDNLNQEMLNVKNTRVNRPTNSKSKRWWQFRKK